MDLGERRRKSNAQKAKAKFVATQAALPEHQRLDATTRYWDVFVWRQLSQGQESAIADMKETFIRFLTDKDLPIKLSPDDAADYFKKGGSVVTTRVLRMFLEFMAQSRTGLNPKADGRLNRQTVHAYVNALGVALWLVQNPIEREIKNAAHAWIDGYLIPEGMVSSHGRDKYTCQNDPQSRSEVLPQVMSMELVVAANLSDSHEDEKIAAGHVRGAGDFAT
jgi:hypothetical protein